MAVYESGNRKNMCMEAVRLPQEMHRPLQHEEDHPAEENRQDEKNIRKDNVLTDIVNKIFSKGKPDSDFLLTAALIYILYREGADLKLILALTYILL